MHTVIIPEVLPKATLSLPSCSDLPYGRALVWKCRAVEFRAGASTFPSDPPQCHHPFQLSVLPCWHTGKEGYDLALGFGWDGSTHGFIIKFHRRQNLKIQTVEHVGVIIGAAEVLFTSEICYCGNMMRKYVLLTNPRRNVQSENIHTYGWVLTSRMLEWNLLGGSLRWQKAPHWRIWISFFYLTIDGPSV